MAVYSVKNARRNFSDIISRAARGESISIEKRGKAIACLRPIGRASMHLPSLKTFRGEITVKGVGISDLVVRLRGQERY